MTHTAGFVSDLKPYPAMKDSGMPWLGDVPEHWESRRVKNLARPGYKTFVDGDWIESPYITTEGIRLIQTGNIGVGSYREKGFRYISESTFKEFACTEYQPGDVLICRLGDPVGRACLAPDLGVRMITSVDVCILKTRDTVLPAYTVYAMSSPQYLCWVNSLVRGSTRDRVSRSMLGGFVVPVPPLPEQTAIVRYLDYMGRRIRRYIRAKQKLIKLLEEQKQAIIHRAVTRGLDPNVSLKPSGVEWLGDVPEHWEVRRAKSVCEAIIDCKNRTPEAFDDGEYLVVRTTCIRDGKFDPKGGYRTDKANYLVWTARGAPRIGDVFFTREAPAGEGCLVPERDDLCMGQRMMYFRPDPRWLDPEFLLLNIYGSLTQTYVELTTNGSTVGHLRLGEVYALPILWCPLEEQKRIVKYVTETSREIDQTRAVADREIELLREYRTRLIADVVTGKLDVRDAVAQLPNEEEEPEIEEELALDEEVETDLEAEPAEA